MKANHIRDLEKVTPNDQDSIVIDIRTPEEYGQGHIPGSINIPREQIRQRLGEFSNYAHVYIHCQSGKRVCSEFESDLNSLPKNVQLLTDSGFMHWAEESKPIETA